jgi:protein O-GlcNAc transferase
MTRNDPHAFSASAVLALLLLVLCTATFIRDTAYRNEIDLWERAVRSAPFKQRSHHNYACALSRAGRYEEALQAFARARSLPADGSVLLSYLYTEEGNAYYHLGRYDDALASWKQALSSSPGNSEIMTNIAVVLVKQGKIQEAETYGKFALSVPDPLAETYEVMGEIALGRQDYRSAAGFLRSALRKRSDLYSAYRAAVLAFEGEHAYAEAFLLTEKYLAENADGPDRQEMRLHRDELKSKLGSQRLIK